MAVPTTLDAWWNVPGTRQADELTYLLVVISIAALLVRRRWPVAVAGICGAALTGWFVLGHHGELLNLPTIVALYTVAAQGNRRRSLFVGAPAVLWSSALVFSVDTSSASFASDFGYPVTETLWPIVALLLGETVRNRRELLAEYAARATRAEADREREARRRVEEEHLRIAREFHDVVAHTVTAMNVQTGLALDAFDVRPEVARRALQQARASGREALQELGATVSVLRDSSTERPTTPVPTLGQIEELVDRAKSTGIGVTLSQEVDAQGLPAVVELAAYRIVQEALTNIVRHAGARTATVSVTSTEDAVVVEVTDDGTSAALVTPASTGDEPGRPSGFGLIGMRERAAAIGGRVEFGRAPEGGFRVRASLPLNGSTP